MDLLRQFLLEAGGWDYEKFVRIWNDAPDRASAAKELGITPEHASSVAAHLRSLGFELKKHPRGRKQGSTVARPEVPRGTLPSKEQFIKMWTDDPSVSRLANKLGLPHDSVRQLLIRLKGEGEEIVEPSGRGRKPIPTPDASTFIGIWQASDNLDDVMEKLGELGFGVDSKGAPLAPEKFRAWVTTLKHRITKMRRAQGKPDLKKLERPAYHKQLKFANELTDEPMDIGAQIGRELEDEPGFDQQPEEQWDDVTQPGAEPTFDDEPADDPDAEFIQVWNAAESFKDAIRALRRVGWELSKDEIKAKVRVLRNSGVDLKKFN